MFNKFVTIRHFDVTNMGYIKGNERKVNTMALKKFRFAGVLAVLILIAFVGGCATQDNGEERKLQKKLEARDRDGSTAPPIDPKPTKEQVELTLYFSDDQAMHLEAEKRTVPKEGKPLATLLVEGLIQGPQDKKGATIPQDTKLLSLEVADGVAFVNFSKEVQINHWGGSTGETMTVQSVVLTLTQLPEIEKVQFLVEGKKQESIWGHGYTGEPIGPQKDLIAK